MTIYFIQAGTDGPVKIGYARRTVAGRMAILQTAHYEQLKVLRTEQGGLLEERALHLRFSASRIRGEWFHLDPAMLTIDLGSLMLGLPDAPWEVAGPALPPPTPVLLKPPPPWDPQRVIHPFRHGPLPEPRARRRRWA